MIDCMWEMGVGEALMVMLRFRAQAVGCITGFFTEMGIQGGAGLTEKVGMRLRVLIWVQ